MQNLPINIVLPDIQTTLKSHNRVVLQAPPGAGKTTAVPIALLEQPWLHNKQIIMLEPRRLAARNAAARMAYLLNEKVGQTIGYQIRQDNCFGDKTKILVVTEGILTRKLQADPELKNIALVIFDEFHERSLHADLSLALCLQSQQIIREDLKILVMSATLNTDAVSNLLADTAKESAPIIQSEGRSFPVDIQYLDKSIKQSDQRQLISSLVNAVKQVIHHHEGSCLVFLPGVKEINLLASQIDQYLKSASVKNILLAPLHGSLNKQQQDQAIATPPDTMRKIVLATNIAETSLTIEGINCVIDSGLERILQYNPSSGMNRLITQSISQDSAVQRSGRAGRLSAGVCYRLWTAQQQQRLLKHSLAEILHSDLSSLVLELANWGVLHADELQWLDTPPDNATEQAKTLLRQLKALDDKGNINQHGRDMLRLGTHPRLAHMMLTAVNLKQPYLACLIASILTEKDLFLANAEKSYDIHDRLNALRFVLSDKKKNQHGIDLQQCKKIIQTADDYLRRLKHSSKGSFNDTLKKDFSDELTGVLLAFAYPDRIAKQRNRIKPVYLLSNGKGASIPPFLQHHLYEYIVIANLDAMPDKNRQGEARIYLAAEITSQQLQDYFSDNMQQTENIEWNEEKQRVDAKLTTKIGKIILHEKFITPENKEIVHQHLIAAIKNTGLQCLDWSPQANSLKHRVQYINAGIENNPALNKQLANEKLPDFSDEALLDTLTDWLQPYLKNENSIKQCQKLDLHTLLINQLSWEQQQIIEKLAPERIKVPSGSSIRINYSDPLKPILAVRLQEVFGLYETPAILNGHCRLMMHLLSPARRPMQVTQDLNSFWQTTYHQVKKELRGKYKRHYWPDDPLTAQATSKTKKQMNN
ncbi:MAG: ATP-dependent helicase HrpB [Gammaproteobacteria bacterium]|nr:ATP-dependent helicase HrpB [Gammaproteobacteria bacterium]